MGLNQRNYMNCYAICATAGRHNLLERSVACFLAQDYKDEHTLLIFNNSEVSQDLGNFGILPPNKHIELINQHLDSKTGKRYKTLGAIYRDALEAIPDSCEVVYHHDDDDFFLPEHISMGVGGLVTYGKQAYKPAKSWYRHSGGIELMNNTLEPSIFIRTPFLRKYGYKDTTSDQHLSWVEELIKQREIYVDPEGWPTLIYDWGGDNPAFKTSGDPNNPYNFDNYHTFSQEHGDWLITPWPREKLDKYYQQLTSYTNG